MPETTCVLPYYLPVPTKIIQFSFLLLYIVLELYILAFAFFCSTWVQGTDYVALAVFDLFSFLCSILCKNIQPCSYHSITDGHQVCFLFGAIMNNDR